MNSNRENFDLIKESKKKPEVSKKTYKKPALLDYGTVSDLTKTTAMGDMTDRPYAPLFPGANMTP